MGYSIAHSNMLYLIDEKGHFYKEISDLNPQEILRELNFSKFSIIILKQKIS